MAPPKQKTGKAGENVNLAPLASDGTIFVPRRNFEKL